MPGPSSLGYSRYIQSPEWAAVRKAKFQQAGTRCQECGGDERLEVHHLTYDRLGHERLEDLQVLCHWCHMREHGRPATGGGPIAGPTVSELSREVKTREAMIRGQERLATVMPTVSSMLESLDGMEPESARANRRRRLIARELHKLACEVAISF